MILRVLSTPNMAPSKIIVSCAACRLHRKKCSQGCILASHFPGDDPEKFSIVQSVFGTKNIIKLLQGLEFDKRADAVNSLVNEASARMKDPIQGSARIVSELEKKIEELESQLAAGQKELINKRSQYDKLVGLMVTGSTDVQNVVYPTDATEDTMYEEADPFLLWEPIRDA